VKAWLLLLLQRRVLLTLRSLSIRACCSAMNWVSDHVAYPDPSAPIGMRDRIRWRLESYLSTAFAWLYAGSDEEIRSVYNSEIPIKHMNARQRAVLTLPRAYYGVHCTDCGWEGLWSQCREDHKCPRCPGTVWLDSFNPSAKD
jgi:hypothetical protein